MSNIEDLTKVTQENILNLMKLTQTSVLEAVKAAAGTAERVAPKISVPTTEVLDKLPNPQRGVALSFDFAEQILQSQREFAESLLSALTSAMPTSPVTGAQGESPEAASSAPSEASSPDTSPEAATSLTADTDTGGVGQTTGGRAGKKLIVPEDATTTGSANKAKPS